METKTVGCADWELVGVMIVGGKSFLQMDRNCLLLNLDTIPFFESWIRS